ncbi:hypothetical protein E1B28_010583 [Marasmius oreades]|uniref:Uncharacterized protein n=1 Tax=Marasmius oreades TaxID=181124 RepID=A0A9P7RXC8_9AGAR|nr:uncharacterized protein E1B28_010583 [Marasmius oreades]KAG7091554.1 hypothetical protein E1B28_010583 [Marasmius oreades]
MNIHNDLTFLKDLAQQHQRSRSGDKILLRIAPFYVQAPKFIRVWNWPELAVCGWQLDKDDSSTDCHQYEDKGGLRQSGLDLDLEAGSAVVHLENPDLLISMN